MRRDAAFLDACVLFAPSVRDLLLQLAHEGLFEPRWSRKVHEEWMAAVLSKRPDITREQLDRTRAMMDGAFPSGTVLGYEHLVAEIELPDPDDRHVLAAAIVCGASTIVTFNTRDFPADVLSAHSIEPLTPDGLILRLIDRDASAVRSAIESVQARLRSPAFTPAEYLRRLSERGLVRTVQRLVEDRADAP